MDIRLQTFENYTGLANKEKLARNGFIFKGETTECFMCGCRYSEWTETDDPEKVHERISPNCKFRISLVCNTSDVENSNNNDVVIQYKEFISYSSRRNTFKALVCGYQATDELASAGFIHIGPRDQTMCYACGFVLADWQITHSPWSEHIKSSPGCYHLSIVMGAHSMKVRKDSTAYSVDICKICFINKMSFCLFPCGHVVSCPSCVDSIVTCCICSKEVTSKRRIYYS